MSTYLERATQRHEQALQALLNFIADCERRGTLRDELLREWRYKRLTKLAFKLERAAEMRVFYEFHCAEEIHTEEVRTAPVSEDCET